MPEQAVTAPASKEDTNAQDLADKTELVDPGEDTTAVNDDAGFFRLGDMEDLLREEAYENEQNARQTRAARRRGETGQTVVMPQAARTAPSPQEASATPGTDPERVHGPAPADSRAPRQAPRQVESVDRAQRDHGRRRARHGFLSFFLWLFSLAVAGLMYLRMLPIEDSTGRAVPELVSFLPAAVIPMVVVLALALWWHRRVLAVVSAAMVATLVVWHAGYFLPAGQLSQVASTATASSTTDDSYARIMTLNTGNGQASATEIVAAVASQNVEVLALQEVTYDFLDQLQAAGIFDYLPHYVYGSARSTDNGGINVLFFKSGASNASSDLVPTENSAMAAGTVVIGGTNVRFVSVHPNSPVRGAQGLWDSGLTSIAGLSEYDHTYVLMGDFNATWDHQAFRALLGTSFVDAGEQAGEGFHMTYPANSKVPPLIEIDHVVYTAGSGVYVGNLQTLEISGTDHQALLGTLERN